ncbi:hypothetical protein Psyc_1830 [Psychrobacter arcticus 273-4]|uniref:Uncharacterized protein n=2 Tax=Psychrobacter arcticus TaxID=334543 RepID=Q4FQN0_PSYA2|nr:hypothetical protein Psyc_1830 [Psychrobacter arcticus 273-4]
MTSKLMQTPKDIQNLDTPMLTIDSLIEAQVTFVQHWLRKQAEPLSMEAWQWLGAQPLSKYISSNDLQRLLNDWLLDHPLSEVMRADIRDILHSLIYHPANDNVPLSELVDDTQVATLADYVGSHEQQRNILIHTLVGNETFADLLTQTLYHAINDFMENTLDKAGGVGKLMKLGRSSFEKATNRNLDEKLQTYLHRNIKDLARRAEANAQEHLSNEEVARLLVTGWARIKEQPISHIQTYLRDEPDNSSIDHIEASIQQSYNRLRMSPYLHSLVAAGVDTWYRNHQSDTIASVAASLHIDEQAMAQLNQALLPVINDALDSTWLTAHIREMLQAFYSQPNITDNLGFNNH